MKRKVETWSVGNLYKKRELIQFPEYQRQANLWPPEKKSLLIDSIVREIDIPKLYFNRTEEDAYEVIDGQQRLWAIWDFLDGKTGYKDSGAHKTFADLSQPEKNAMASYDLQVVVFDDAETDYLRELFLRLQLGLLLVTGEKLHAATGKMREFVFDVMVNESFIQKVRIPPRRFAKETLCAQIAINAFSRVKSPASFSRTRYEDLLQFFTEYAEPKGTDLKFFGTQADAVLKTLKRLDEAFGDRASALTNRSYILSIYFLLAEEVSRGKGDVKTIAEFALKLWERLKAEAQAGIDRVNRELYSFETVLSSAPGERYQIERRHEKLKEYYEHYRSKGGIKGDESA